ncbi:hypothetical protein [Dyadobacter sp. 22481]|uniref:hypothetical protein n=1 Tax=Dyadobacter sp. 22481 TaxID=3453926 RepID=UPI003F84E46D
MNFRIVRSLVFSCLVCLILTFISCGGSERTASPPQEPELEIGGDYPVMMDVTACVTEKDLDELGEFITAGDEEGFKQMIVKKVNNGTAFRLDKGTKVKLIDMGFGWVKVRVLEGAYQNELGYFDTEFIKGFNN